MPHACVKCTQVHPDKSEAILKGCACGSRIFYFLKNNLPKAEASQLARQLSSTDTDSIVDEVAQAAGDKTIIIEPNPEPDAVENIRVLEPGAYHLNVPSLMKGGPVILRSDADVYYVRLPLPKNKETGGK